MVRRKAETFEPVTKVNQNEAWLRRGPASQYMLWPVGSTAGPSFASKEDQRWSASSSPDADGRW
jgi:hypothetical protein